MIAHCLFEQSGTFKNEFKKLGYEAYDYDIQNEFGETDYVVDLFAEIESAYEGNPSIFDNISTDDLIVAFFPCTRFECQCLLLFWGKGSQHKKMKDEEKLELDIKLHGELHDYYVLICKLSIIALRKGVRMVIENPANQPHYLSKHWCLSPKIIDKDRRENGDWFKKPTQYWFINFEPYNNFVFEPIEYVEPKTCNGLTAMEKSIIHPQYASRFIRQYLVKG